LLLLHYYYYYYYYYYSYCYCTCAVESPPSGPTAFWSLCDHVSNYNALVVAQHADVCLRNQLGMTLLHAAVAKRRLDAKNDVIATLLSRGVDVSARDFEGSTARDYITIHRVQ